MDLMRAGNGQS